MRSTAEADQMPSKFLVAFVKRWFPDGCVPVYSRETFNALCEKITVAKQEGNNHEQQKPKSTHSRQSE